METQRVFTTVDELQSVIEACCKQTKCTKIRIFERDESYQDYTVTYTLAKQIQYNFFVTEDESNLILQKKAKKSTCHIKFPKGSTCIVEYVKKHVPYLAIKVQADVFYTDGTHRYRK